MNTIRLVIADDHDMTRNGIKDILEGSADITVVGEATNGMEAQMLVEELQPDVLLVDLLMPDRQGIDLVFRLAETGNQTKIVVLSTLNDPEVIEAMIQLGVAGYIVKGGTPEALIKMIRAVVSIDSGQGSNSVDEDMTDKSTNPFHFVFSMN